MPDAFIKWATALLFIAVGISFFTTIWVRWLPEFIHWIIGLLFVSAGGYLAYMEVK